MKYTVDTADLTKPQLEFAINVMGDIIEKLIQNDMDLDESGNPLPVNEQSNSNIKQAMKLLNYD